MMKKLFHINKYIIIFILGALVSWVGSYGYMNYTKSTEIKARNFLLKNNLYGKILYNKISKNPFDETLILKNIKIIKNEHFPYEHKINEIKISKFIPTQQLPKEFSFEIEGLYINLIDLANKYYEKKPKELEKLKNFNIKNNFVKNPLKTTLVAGIKKSRINAKFNIKKKNETLFVDFVINDYFSVKISGNIVFANISTQCEETFLDVIKIALFKVGLLDKAKKLNKLDLYNLKRVVVKNFEIQIFENGLFGGLKSFITSLKIVQNKQAYKPYIDDEKELNGINYLVDNEISVSKAKKIMQTLVKASKQNKKLAAKSEQSFFAGKIDDLDITNLIKFIKISDLELYIPDDK